MRFFHVHCPHLGGTSTEVHDAKWKVVWSKYTCCECGANVPDRRRLMEEFRWNGAIWILVRSYTKP